MTFSNIFQSLSNTPFTKLINQAKKCIFISQELRYYLPENISTHILIAYIYKRTLVIVLDNSIAAKRFLMIFPSIQSGLSFINQFDNYKIKLEPENNLKYPVIKRTISNESKQIIADTAFKIKHHPTLANVVYELSNFKNKIKS